MRHPVKPECRHGCRFLQLTPALTLCPHTAYGEASYLKGAVEDARALLEKLGGYEAVLMRTIKKEDERRYDKEEERARQR